jgi:hypothetical protein
MELIKVVDWDSESREAILKADSELCAIIDGLKIEEQHFKLVRIRVPYGATLYERGIFYIPSKKGMIPLQNASFDMGLPEEIKKALLYQTVPLGVVTKNSFEVFREAGDHIFPLAHRKNGFELGIWETFSPPSPFTITAGARSIFLLPKINDINGYKRLKKYGAKTPRPSTVFEQWYNFCEIANHSSFSEKWYCEIYLFTEDWKNNMLSNPAWSPFYNYVLRKGLAHTEPERIKTNYDIVLTNFSSFLQSKRIKKDPYIMETFKHLLAIANGILPAFKVVKNSSSIPAKGIAETYIEGYGLKSYVPTMMYADYFDANSNDVAYYSLQVPTFLSNNTRDNDKGTTKNDLIELIDLVDHFMRELTSNRLGQGSEYLIKLFGKVEFNFFHNDEDLDHGIYSTKDMAKEDADLIYKFTPSENEEFCYRSTFVRGCIRISNKKEVEHE